MVDFRSLVTYLSYGLMQTNFYSKFGHIHSSVHTNANLLASTYKFSTITSSTVLVGSSPDDKITLLFSDHIMSIVYKTPVTIIYIHTYIHTYIYIYMYIRMYVCTYIQTQTDRHKHTEFVV